MPLCQTPSFPDAYSAVFKHIQSISTLGEDLDSLSSKPHAAASVGRQSVQSSNSTWMTGRRQTLWHRGHVRREQSSLLQRGSIKLGMVSESNHNLSPVYCRPRTHTTDMPLTHAHPLLCPGGKPAR